MVQHLLYTSVIWPRNMFSNFDVTNFNMIADILVDIMIIRMTTYVYTVFPSVFSILWYLQCKSKCV